MGVIFQNGMAIGAVPGYSNFGVPRSWLLGIENFGCQPAWDNGVMVLIPWFIGGCFGSADLFGVIGDGSPNFGFYISGIDSTGTDQSAFLSQVIGQTGTMTFTQGGSSITIGFDETTFNTNTYSATDGIYYENNTGTATAPFIVGGTGTFYGFNNAGHGTNSSGGSGEQYYAQPSNTQVLTITINVGITPTPTPTIPSPTATPGPTPTPGPTLYVVSISTVHGDEISACGGTGGLYAYSTNNGYPLLGDIYYTTGAGTTTLSAGWYLNGTYNSAFEIDGSGVLISGPNSC
jgi:hypothetical protein